jgi:hypothetical protein
MNYKAVPKKASGEVPEGNHILQADQGNLSRNMNETT